jgi:hypothetical protein
MNEWMVSSDAMERVRAGVMGRVRRRRMVRRGLVVAALLLVAAIWPVMPEAETLALRMPVAPAAPEWVTVAVEKPVERMAKQAARGPEKITLYTADPDVVIVLVADGGES